VLKNQLKRVADKGGGEMVETAEKKNNDDSRSKYEIESASFFEKAGAIGSAKIAPADDRESENEELRENLARLQEANEKNKRELESNRQELESKDQELESVRQDNESKDQELEFLKQKHEQGDCVKC